jgi:hypothetical protein
MKFQAYALSLLHQRQSFISTRDNNWRMLNRFHIFHLISARDTSWWVLDRFPTFGDFLVKMIFRSGFPIFLHTLQQLLHDMQHLLLLREQLLHVYDVARWSCCCNV